MAAAALPRFLEWCMQAGLIGLEHCEVARGGWKANTGPEHNCAGPSKVILPNEPAMPLRKESFRFGGGRS